jgi:hypothetical protein
MGFGNLAGSLAAAIPDLLPSFLPEKGGGGAPGPFPVSGESAEDGVFVFLKLGCRKKAFIVGKAPVPPGAPVLREVVPEPGAGIVAGAGHPYCSRRFVGVE